MDVPVRLIPAARAVNASMPGHIFRLIKNQLQDLNGKRVLILGFAYLQDSDDDRNAPSRELAGLLESAGAEVIIHDPYIQEYKGELLSKADGCHIAVLMTAHSEYKQLDLTALASILSSFTLIDGRNLVDPQAAKQAGLNLLRLGDTSRRVD
jgi:UDP-N-acetyl-D-mannosaminuronic acid dehydrogenase